MPSRARIPSKVDRSAAYAARYVAKNLVAAGLAARCEVQVSYAIGVAEPTSVMVDAFGTSALSREQLTELVRRHFDLTPYGLRVMLDLTTPDLPEDRRLRPLRPQGRGVHLGADRPGRGARRFGPLHGAAGGPVPQELRYN